MGKPATIDEYIAAQPAEVQPLLEAVRETIRAAAPGATEKISWQMPTFWQGENLIHFAAFKNHLGVYPGDLSLAPIEDRLEGKRRTKGAIQFPYNEPVDFELIADITRWHVFCAAGKRENNDDMNTNKMTRTVYSIPYYISSALDGSGLWERYRARPPYQRNDYIGWITRAKREETRKKRLNQMLDELRGGETYMGMGYHAKG